MLKNDPKLVTTDTTFADTSVTPPPVKDSLSFIIKPDSNQVADVDSLTDHFKGRVDSTILDSMNTGFKNILNEGQDIDTTVKTKTGKYHVHGNTKKKIDVDLVVDPPPVKITYPKIIKTIKPVPPAIKLKWYEEVFIWVGKEFLIVVGSLMILIFLVLAVRWIYKEITGR